MLSFLTESEKAANDASLALSVLNRHLGDGEKGDGIVGGYLCQLLRNDVNHLNYFYSHTPLGSSSADVVSAVGRGVTILAHRYLHAAEGNRFVVE